MSLFHSLNANTKIRTTKSSIPPRYLNLVPVCLNGIKAGNVHLHRVVGGLIYQVTLRISETFSEV